MAVVAVTVVAVALAADGLGTTALYLGTSRAIEL
jgi:hypothetical protein